MGLTKSFEKKLFFVFGRHIWNIVGISGFVSVLIGIIFFANSYTIGELKTRSQYFGESYKLKTKQEFFGKNFVDYELEKQKLINSGTILGYSTWIKEMKNMENGYSGYWKNDWSNNMVKKYGTDDFTKAYTIYKKQQYDKYVNKFLGTLQPRINSQNKEYIIYKNNLLSKQKEMENRYEKYKNNFYVNENMKLATRTTSIIPITWGFGVLSVSSVFSAIFSIERNTSKDKSD